MVLTWLGVAAYFVVLGGLSGLAGTALARRLAVRFALLDHPTGRAIHTEATPLLGGLGIVLSMFVMVWGHLLLGQFAHAHPDLAGRVPAVLQRYLPSLGSQGWVIGLIFAGGLVMALLGLFDDVKGLSVRKRVYVEFAVATVVVALGVRPSLGFLPEPLPALVGIVWLVGITNSFNLIDGVDGLAGGIGAITSLNLATLMLITGHVPMAVFLFCLAGACIGFLRYNWHPARIFMGSMGSLFIGFLLGASTLIATFATSQAGPLLPLLVPILIFAVPLYDTTSVILIRLRRNASIFQGDRSHIHHRLMRLGFSTRQTVIFLYIMCFAFGLGAMLIHRMDAIGNAVILVQAGVLIALIALMERIASGRNGERVPARDPAVTEKTSRVWIGDEPEAKPTEVKPR